jgi:hypothetical protein
LLSSNIPIMPPCTWRLLTLDVHSDHYADRSANHPPMKRRANRENSTAIRTKTELLGGCVNPKPMYIDLEYETTLND